MNIPAVSKQPGVRFKNGRAQILVWAPNAASVTLHVRERGLQIPLQQEDRGYWSAERDDVKPGELYQFSLNGDDVLLPDPASLSQPEGVHGPSQALDLHTFTWHDQQWINPPLSDYIIYELHTGTFGSAGTFTDITARLDYLVSLGITAIELMPVAAFPGNRNWGYDGVFPYAVHHGYGGADGLRQLIDQCHAKGLAVILDVVYNHIGPEGNYLTQYGNYFTDKYQTPWGSAVNFDDAGSDEVRRFFIQNALMWLRDFHIDALRLDAVHAIKDFGATHLLRELRAEVDDLMQETGSMYYLIVECDLNDTRFIDPPAVNGFGMDAQWMDEFHHALRVAAGGDTNGYYADFNGLAHLAKSYRDAYVYDGSYSPHRQKTFGSKTANEGKQFIVFSQNHDQVGNRMLGERTSTLHGFELQKLLAAAVLVSPFLPMLFMGEEYGETNPFLYFVSHTDADLIEAVRNGRKDEFAAFHAQGEAPDPQAEATFLSSKLQWQLLGQPGHRMLLDYYKTLIALRKSHPAFRYPDRKGVTVSFDTRSQTITLGRSHGHHSALCLMNFSDQTHTLPLKGSDHFVKIFDSADTRWGGHSAAAGRASGSVDVQPHSILIYAPEHV